MGALKNKENLELLLFYNMMRGISTEILQFVLQRFLNLKYLPDYYKQAIYILTSNIIQ
jgi:hypothetical protein